MRFRSEHCTVFVFELLSTTVAKAGSLLQQLMLPDVRALIELHAGQEVIHSVQQAVRVSERLKELLRPFIISRRSQQLAHCYSIHTAGPVVFVQVVGLIRTYSDGLCCPVLFTNYDGSAQQQQCVVNVNLNVNGTCQTMCFFSSVTKDFDFKVC